MELVTSVMIQPTTAMFGRGMKLDALQDAPGLGGREGLIQGSGLYGSVRTQNTAGKARVK